MNSGYFNKRDDSVDSINGLKFCQEKDCEEQCLSKGLHMGNFMNINAVGVLE